MKTAKSSPVYLPTDRAREREGTEIKTEAAWISNCEPQEEEADCEEGA